MTRTGLALGLLMWSATLVAQPAVERAPEPRPGRPLQDGDFRVSSRQFGLEREVEMFQWRSGTRGYEGVWNGALIDSSSFPPEYRNPDRLPIGNRRWWAEDATLDGRPIDVEVLRALGRWQEFRPDFKKLPLNLAASFQPEGNGLGTSENPLAPQVGDLRIRWRELLLDDVTGQVQLQGGVWKLTPQAAARAVAPKDVVVAIDPEVASPRRWWPWLAGGALIVFVAALAGGRRNRGDRE